MPVSAVDVVHDEVDAEISHDVLEQQLRPLVRSHRTRTGTPCIFSSVCRPLFRIPGGDAHTHALSGEQPGAARADAGAAANDERNVS
jgi:hypothetical protein